MRKKMRQIMMEKEGAVNKKMMKMKKMMKRREVSMKKAEMAMMKLVKAATKIKRHNSLMMGKKISKMMGKSRMMRKIRIMRRTSIKAHQAVKERVMTVLTKISPSMTKKFRVRQVQKTSSQPSWS